MSAQERFDNLPSQFATMDVRSIVSYWLKGQVASANHPISSKNPTEYFVIQKVRIDEDLETGIGRIYVRGEDTVWFSEELFKVDVVGM